MNTRKDAVRVLCFGDSNTWGCLPGTQDNPLRYPSDRRWTGIVQNLLGTGYEIIEEGLNSRYIAMTDLRPGKEGKNAMEYIRPCLDSHTPLDYGVLMLGTNDMRNRYGFSAEDIGRSMENFIKVVISRASPNMRVVLISPPYVNDKTDFTMEHDRFKGAGQKSRELAGIYSLIAETEGVEFLDAGPITSVGNDGVHLTEKGHADLAKAIAEILM
ncbi:MAG: GDSL-type esterase/lipase family protein [Candidatus Colwellbacteria bacterium]|nr:GDSL-type esterase/lipase family protein [Candidatus Colwellbacteria bacterium]